jgi:S1-C subfamily serine protease
LIKLKKKIRGRNMKPLKKYIVSAVAGVLATCTLFAAGCSTEVSVVSIDQSENGFTVTYSDGSTSQINVENGKDGSDVTMSDVYSKYVEEYGDISYADFLNIYLGSTSSSISSNITGTCLQSVVKVYSEFGASASIRTSLSPWARPVEISYIFDSTGSGVIWSIDDEYSYIVTNYHVVYNTEADEDENGGTKIAKALYCYLYGSEGSPTAVTANSGYPTAYDYGNYAISCEYVGGSITSDIAVLKAKTSDIKAINENVTSVTPADTYYVGESAMAIGNPENEGISVTKGIISIENEYIALNIDGTSRYYRSIRMDTAIYSGSSGGGLFNDEGKLIGITNAGDNTDQNINFAVPIEIVKNTVESVLYYADGGTKNAYTVDLGLSLASEKSKYVYDISLGYGRIVEDVVVSDVVSSSIAKSLNIQKGDIITALTVNGTNYDVIRTFNITDMEINLRAGDNISITFTRNGVKNTTTTYQITSSDISVL